MIQQLASSEPIIEEMITDKERDVNAVVNAPQKKYPKIGNP